MQRTSRSWNRGGMLLQSLILVILSTHAAVTYGQSQGWQFQLNFHSDTSRSMHVIFQLGPLNVFSTPATMQAPLTPCGPIVAGVPGISAPEPSV